MLIGRLSQQFISGAGFGNCVVISQNAAPGTGNPTSTTAAGDSTPAITPTGGNSNTAAATSTGSCHAKKRNARAAGSDVSVFTQILLNFLF